MTQVIPAMNRASDSTLRKIFIDGTLKAFAITLPINNFSLLISVSLGCIGYFKHSLPKRMMTIVAICLVSIACILFAGFALPLFTAIEPEDKSLHSDAFHPT